LGTSNEIEAVKAGEMTALDMEKAAATRQICHMRCLPRRNNNATAKVVRAAQTLLRIISRLLSQISMSVPARGVMTRPGNTVKRITIENFVTEPVCR
jgi:hypothetical protein